MNHRRTATLMIFFAITLYATSAVGQTPQAAVPPIVSLSVGGEVARPLKLGAAELAKLPRQTVRVTDHGKEAVFEGVPLIEVLKLAGVEFGESLRGKQLETYLLVEAADGYKAVFALPELDPAFTQKIVLLADKRDGKALVGQEGHLRVVVPDEKRAARWVRQVITLTVRRS